MNNHWSAKYAALERRIIINKRFLHFVTPEDGQRIGETSGEDRSWTKKHFMNKWLHLWFDP